MKSVKQWFNHLPSGTKKAAHYALRNDKTDNGKLQAESLSIAIAAFLWHATPEGFHFWCDLMYWAKEQEEKENFNGRYTWKK